MKKKLAAGILCVAMGTGLLAGCGSDAQNPGTKETQSGAKTETDKAVSEGDTIKIGVELYDPSDDQTLAIQKYFSYLEENLNVEFIYSEALADASAELDFINSCAAAGAQGIFGYYNLAEGGAVEACIDKGMYYWGTEAIYEDFKTNDHYVGCYGFGDAEHNGDYIGGYQLGYSLGEAGVKHAFYCNGGASMGIPMFVDRQNGFIAGIAAAQKEGFEIKFDEANDIVAGWPDAPDFASNLESKIAGDYDGAAASFNAAALFQPLGQAGKLGSGEFKIATIGEVCDTYLDFVDSKTIASVVYDCEEVVFGCGVVQLVNAIRGNRLTDADGNALKVNVNRWTVTDADMYKAIYNFHEDGNFFVDAEMVKKMTSGEMSAEEINKFYSELTVEAAVASIK